MKCVRTNNTKEFIQGEAKEFYASHSIRHESSCRDTSQQNGVVERKQKHILETARTLFFQSRLPMSFWGDCVQCAVHVINKMPLSVLKRKSPFEVLFGKKPDYSHLKVFGYLCFVSTFKRNRHKFMPRAHKSVFIGYSLSQKGYKIYNLKTKEVIVSKDVVFFEHHFPYHQEDDTNRVHNFFLPVNSEEAQHSVLDNEQDNSDISAQDRNDLGIKNDLSQTTESAKEEPLCNTPEFPIP